MASLTPARTRAREGTHTILTRVALGLHHTLHAPRTRVIRALSYTILYPYQIVTASHGFFFGPRTGPCVYPCGQSRLFGDLHMSTREGARASAPC